MKLKELININKDLIKGFIVFIFWFIINIYYIDILRLLNINFSNWDNNDIVIFNFVMDLIILITSLIILFKYIKIDFIEFIGKIKHYLKKSLKYWGITLLLSLIINSIVLMVAKDEPINQQGIDELLKTLPIISSIIICLIGPIVEELVFRLSLYKILNKYPKIFILVSGLIFGLMHLNSGDHILYLLAYSMPGIILALTYTKTKNIFVPISIHIFNNTLSLIVSCIEMIM